MSLRFMFISYNLIKTSVSASILEYLSISPTIAVFTSINQFLLSQPNTHIIIMTTCKKLLYGVTGSTQGADAPLVRATHVLKTSSTPVSYTHLTLPTILRV